ncbi:MAG: sodium:alanine symporter family protein [Spirochaetaceae bacterium]|jgi:AGCS family alanine or glycine:cation symporter|nr:sodium:alanine symporter family protein [Spirochaetaceae bacterium]
MEALGNILGSINSFMWGWWFIVLLFGTHLFLTIRLKFPQRYLGRAIKLSFTKDPDAQGDVSQFGALCTALASTIGTGNIVGVGTAIALGGPGAVLWMWLTGVFGMATKYAECLIAVKYRVKDKNGMMLGGAMYALERGLNARWLGIIFAFLAAICAFGIGAMVQSNAVVGQIQDSFGVPSIASGIVLTILVGAVIIGGLKRITKVSEVVIPFMTIFYVLGCIIILIINGPYLGQALGMIVESAFNPKAAGAGFISAVLMEVMRRGISRGLFSNESGMGSAPLVAANATTRNSVRQALVSMTGTFWDTVIVCALSGLVVVSTIIAPNHINSTSAEIAGNGGKLISAAFDAIAPGGVPIGKAVLTVGLFFFASSTILGWAHYGERAATYLWSEKATLPYRIIYVVFVFIGTVVSLQIVWDAADIFNAAMAVPNIIAVLLLSNVVAKETKKYLVPGHMDESIMLKDEDPIPLRTDLLKK